VSEDIPLEIRVIGNEEEVGHTGEWPLDKEAILAVCTNEELVYIGSWADDLTRYEEKLESIQAKEKDQGEEQTPEKDCSQSGQQQEKMEGQIPLVVRAEKDVPPVVRYAFYRRSSRMRYKMSQSHEGTHEKCDCDMHITSTVDAIEAFVVPRYQRGRWQTVGDMSIMGAAQIACWYAMEGDSLVKLHTPDYLARAYTIIRLVISRGKKPECETRLRRMVVDWILPDPEEPEVRPSVRELYNELCLVLPLSWAWEVILNTCVERKDNQFFPLKSSAAVTIISEMEEEAGVERVTNVVIKWYTALHDADEIERVRKRKEREMAIVENRFNRWMEKRILRSAGYSRYDTDRHVSDWLSVAHILVDLAGEEVAQGEEPSSGVERGRQKKRKKKSKNAIKRGKPPGGGGRK
jgi:hypothetical protein